MNKEVDVLIIGGGLTGATLMLALQGLGVSTLLVEAKPFSDKTNPYFDARSLALSPASQRILSMIGVWDLLKNNATAIEQIHISHQDHFGTSRLYKKPDFSLGYVIEMQYINQALHQLLPHNNLMAPALLHSLDVEKKSAKIHFNSNEINVTAQLIVAADGTQSTVRHLCGLPTQLKNYEQHGLVTNIGLIKPHGQKAFERFTAHGLLALLPLKENRMALVWAVPPLEATHLMNLSDLDFLKKLQKTFGYRLGKFAKVGARYTYPLQQVLMPIQAKYPVVFVGNAAHTLHPVAGQGFNLGLRDVATLAQCIATQGLSSEMLRHYTQLRSVDQKAIIRLTDSLIQVFNSRIPGIGLARGLGLVAFDNIPLFKNLLARYAGGFGGVIPDLVCEIALSQESS